ncbi:uncharacterized protein FIBRA_04230 [Fibroporia radiculosa]|uniref:NAD(P)-binding protein n=1 Tax=Fibroporia radiculosa TaxID=599839 RepID=J4HWF1_9APHY|nr:uncharacterized protein FIBRA_04230 [Fibroporia radiculosa]CCM02152.1 predicted protein [Fibroporia radiculosa]
MASLTEYLALVAVAFLAPQLYRFINFIWLYFLRPCTVHEYLHTSPSYALITGASDGIGKALAQELYDRGFSLILHGRNEEKMRKVCDQIRRQGSRNVHYFIADASAEGHDFAKMMEPFKDLHITLVVHNVGSSELRWEKTDGLSEEYLLDIVRRNALFPMLLTRVLLPKLRAAAKSGPVLVQFIGSQAGDISPPRLGLYAGSKSFLKALARSLDTDELVWETPSGVRFEYLLVGQVQSNSMQISTSIGTPSSERFAKAIVARMGCGWRKYAPYMPHAVMQWSMEAMGENVVDMFTAQAIGELTKKLEKKA